MKEDTVKIAVTVVVLLVAVPIIINGVVLVGAVVYSSVASVIGQVKFSAKMKKGLKDGSIVKIGKDYFEVEVIEEA